jgi:hypothetical protein
MLGKVYGRLLLQSLDNPARRYVDRMIVRSWSAVVFWEKGTGENSDGVANKL